MILQNYAHSALVFGWASVPTMRLLLAGVLLLSAISILRLIPYLNERYTPNCWFIFTWSTVNSVLILLLALGNQDAWVIQVLNGSSIFLIGGWAVLILRVSTVLRGAANQPFDTKETRT